jgi:hypothetical protein
MRRPGGAKTWQRPGSPKASRPRLTLPVCASERASVTGANPRWRHHCALRQHRGFRPAPTCIASLPEPGRRRFPGPSEPGDSGRGRASLNGPVMATAAAACATTPGVTSAGNAAVFRAVFAPMLSTFRKKWARRRASTIGTESRRRGHSERDRPPQGRTAGSVSAITVATPTSA